MTGYIIFGADDTTSVGERGPMGDDELFAEAVRGFLMEKHLPWRLVDVWADEIVAIARDAAQVAAALNGGHEIEAERARADRAEAERDAAQAVIGHLIAEFSDVNDEWLDGWTPDERAVVDAVLDSSTSDTPLLCEGCGQPMSAHDRLAHCPVPGPCPACAALVSEQTDAE